MRMSQFFAPGLIDRLSTLWREFVPQRTAAEASVDKLRPSLPDDDLAKVRQQLLACLEGKGGEVSARARAAKLGQAYLSLDDEGQARFLQLLAREFDTDHAAVDRAVGRMHAAKGGEERSAAERALRKALEAPRRRLLTQFNALPNGVKFLVDMRSALMSLAREDKSLKGLEADLKYLLRNWFDVGFLELRRITWESPAAVLEKIIAYEAVHAIRDWNDLKNRLDSDRRLYAFFHPRMPDEPLIFVQVALLDSLAGNIQHLLDEAAPVGDPAEANTAIFYSISNAQRGLDGISFGNFLIKKVVGTLSAEFPKLKNFATLSPVPGFRKWLDDRLKQPENGLMTPAEQKALLPAARRFDPAASDGAVALRILLAQNEWWKDPVIAEVVKAPMTRLCARYLVQEKRPAKEEGGVPTALNPVAHFHLTNGARVERLNWLGDTSPNGLKQAYGMMVNYLYKLNEIDRNHETYADQGIAVPSPTVKSLL